MQTIIAIIKPFKLDEVREALIVLGFVGMTVTDAKGFGRQRGHSVPYRGTEYVVSFLPKCQVTITVPDADVERAVEAIMQAARTGRVGDGRITVIPTTGFWNIGTGEPLHKSEVCGAG